MQSNKNKKAKVIWLSVGAFVLTTILTLAGVGIYLKLSKKESPQVMVNPLEFSVDKWDGTISGVSFSENYANRGLFTKTINSASSFVHFIEEVNKGNTFENYTIYLNSNLDFKGKTIPSIGNEENSFKGVFDGGHYTIFNANIDGEALFENTQNTIIKNLGLYNCNKGLVNTATNTNIENCYVRLGSGILVNEMISNHGEHYIKNSFVDNSGKGLVGKVNTNTSSEHQVTISNCYFTKGDSLLVEIDQTQFVVIEENNIKATKNETFSGWSYSKEYSNEYDWCDYDYLTNSQKLDFNYPLPKGFVKVFLTGSCIESVMVAGDTVVDASNLAEAFVEADKESEAEINLLVEKVFMEAQAELENNSIVTVNAVKDTTILRGNNNSESMFVASGNSKIVLGKKNNISSMSSSRSSEPTLTIDGNRQYFEKNNIESGAMIVADECEVEINENVVIKNNINTTTNYGGGILLLNAKPNSVINGKIENCHAKNGGAVAIIGTLPQEIPNAKNCSAEENGGALYIAKTVDNDSLQTINKIYGKTNYIKPLDGNNHEDYYSDVEISGKSYTNIESYASGGAIYCEGNLILTDCIFSGNGVYTSYGGGVVYATGKVTLEGECEFTNSSGSGSGGGIYALNGVVLNGTSTFSNNNWAHDGGAIYSPKDVIINGTATFTSNMCTRGGAIYTDGNVEINNRCVFSENSAYYDGTDGRIGGAIYAGGKVTIKAQSTFTNNVAGNEHNQGSGGAIYAVKNVDITANSNFVSNIAYNGNGGAIYCSILSITAETNFNYNKAYTTEWEYFSSGGAIYASQVSIKNTNFLGNTAEGQLQADACAISGGSSVYLENCEFSSNSGAGDIVYGTNVVIKDTKFIDNSPSNSYPLGVLSGTNITLYGNNTTFSGNSVWMGGIIYSGGTITIYDSPLFEENHIDDGYDASTVYGKKVIINGSPRFMGNRTTDKGGAIYANELEIKGDPSFYGNRAKHGGAICVSTLRQYVGYVNGKYQYTYIPGKLTITGNPVFEENVAEVSGGAISVWNEYEEGAVSAKIMGNVQFRNNKIIPTSEEMAYGGALCVIGDLTILNSYFNNNMVDSNSDAFIYYSENSRGGAIYVEGNAIVNNCTFESHYVYGNGGAIYSASTLTVNNSEFDRNSVSYYGGAIYAIGKLTINSSLIKNSDAGGCGFSNFEGGAIYACSDVEIDSGDFRSNRIQNAYETTKGGAIYTPGKVTIKGTSQFIDNSLFGYSSYTYGGAIYCSNLEISDNVVFKDNSSEGSSETKGGAVYVSEDVTIFGNATFDTNNTPYSNGGAIYATNVEITESANITIKGVNIAGSGTFDSDAHKGGAIYAINSLTVNGMVKVEVGFTCGPMCNINTLYAGSVINLGSDLVVTYSPSVDGKEYGVPYETVFELGQNAYVNVTKQLYGSYEVEPNSISNGTKVWKDSTGSGFVGANEFYPFIVRGRALGASTTENGWYVIGASTKNKAEVELEVKSDNFSISNKEKTYSYTVSMMGTMKIYSTDTSVVKLANLSLVESSYEVQANETENVLTATLNPGTYQFTVETVGVGDAGIVLEFAPVDTSYETTKTFVAISVQLISVNITVSEIYKLLTFGDGGTFNYSADANGTFTITSTAPNIAGIYYTDKVVAGTTYSATIYGRGAGTCSINVAFTPDDELCEIPESKTVQVQVEHAKLETPSNISLTARADGALSVLSWNKVEYRDVGVSYSIQMYKGGSKYGEPIVLTDLSYDFYDILKVSDLGIYTFSVTAISDDEGCLNSTESSKIGTTAVKEFEVYMYVNEEFFRYVYGETYVLIPMVREGYEISRVYAPISGRQDVIIDLKSDGSIHLTQTDVYSNSYIVVEYQMIKYTVTIEIAGSDESGAFGSVNKTSVQVSYGSSFLTDGAQLTLGSEVVTATPKEKDEQYTYSFSHWSGIHNLIIGDCVVVAHFTRTINVYNVVVEIAEDSVGYGLIMLNGIGDDNQEVITDYGTSIVFEENTLLIGEILVSANPEPCTNQFDYSFSHWSGKIEVVNGNVTIKAHFIRNWALNEITIDVEPDYYGTIRLNNGDEKQTIGLQFVYGTSISYYDNELTIGTDVITATPAESTDQYTYVFVGWDNVPGSGKVTEPILIIARFARSVNYYNVTFDPTGGECDESHRSVPYGSTYGSDENPLPTPTRTGYEFNGWYGKNLLNIDDIKDYSNWSDSIATTGSHPTSANNKGYLLNVEEGKEYTISYSLYNNSNIPAYLYLCKLTGTEGVNIAYLTTSSVSKLSYTFTAEPGVQYFLRIGQSTNETMFNEEINKIKTIQLEIGSTATEYEKFVKDERIVNDTIMNVAFNHTLYADWTPIEYTITYLGLDGATVNPANLEKYTIETPTFTLNNPVHPTYQFAGWKETGVDGIRPIVTISKGTIGDKEFTAMWYQQIIIEVIGNQSGNAYGVTVYDADNVLVNTYTESFDVVIGETYTFKVSGNVLSDETNNDYQILRIKVNGETEFTTYSPVESGITLSTIVNKQVITGSMVITFEYLSAYMMKVNAPENSVAGINVNLINEGTNVIIAYTSANAYIIADGTPVSFTVDSTPTSTGDDKHSFVGLDFIVNSETKHVGTEGGQGIQFTDFVHNGSYKSDRDVGIYTYSITTGVEISELTVLTVINKEVYIVKSAIPEGESITIESEHGLNKVIDSDTNSVMLYSGTWTVTVGDLPLEVLEQVFPAYKVQTSGNTYVIIVP